jgi:hypothetical protein
MEDRSGLRVDQAGTANLSARCTLRSWGGVILIYLGLVYGLRLGNE